MSSLEVDESEEKVRKCGARGDQAKSSLYRCADRVMFGNNEIDIIVT